MAVIRVEKNEGFTVMSNCHLRDDRLSLKAIGLLSKILSLPENWDYTVEGLASICKEGRRAVSSALAELEDAGYVKRTQLHNENGLFDSMDYTVYEHPITDDAPTEAVSNSPLARFPLTDNPLTDNVQQINKDLNNNIYIPPISPPNETQQKGRGTKSAPKHEPERFERFWSVYPRHEGRQKAIAAWDKLHADPGLLDRMARSLAQYLKCPDWDEGRIPHASTWLNQRRFEEPPYMGAKHPPSYHSDGGWAPDEEMY